MRHSWDYGGSDAYNATSRTCRKCGLRGHSYSAGRTRFWTFTWPDGTSAGHSGRSPLCPGVPVASDPESLGALLADVKKEKSG